MQRPMGLQLIKPKSRLISIIILTSLFAFIVDLILALVVFSTSILILLSGNKVRYKKSFFAVIAITTFYMLLGNWLFSPHQDSETKLLIFTLNSRGLLNGVIAVLKRNAMIILSFAWLASIDSMNDIYKSIDYFGKNNKLIIFFLKWMQNTAYDFSMFYKSLLLRDTHKRKKNVFKKLRSIKIILKAIINSFFGNIGKMTYSGESHYNKGSVATGANYFPITLKNISVSYHESSNLKLTDINISVSPGEIIFIAGSNCSGKSTLLKVISAFIPKIEGKIKSGTANIGDLSSENSIEDITAILRFISDSAYESILGLTVEQELFSQSENRDLIERCAKLMGIYELLNRDTFNLSGGEQVRLLIAGLLCSDVKVIVLDSVMGQLDIIGRATLIKALGEIAANKNVTIIISDSDLTDFTKLITRVVVLDNGRIIEEFNFSDSHFKEKLERHKLKYPDNLKLPNLKRDFQRIVLLKDVSLKIGEIKILENISCEIYSNQIIAILGANGSGKSTLAYLIASVLKPSHGHIEANVGVGIIFQNPTKQILESSVSEEIYLQQRLSGAELPGFRVFYNDILKQLELEEYELTMELSSSQMKLLEIASNIYINDLIILDEPTNGLDSNNVQKLFQLLETLITTKKSLIIITHDINIAKFCNRFIVIDQGKIVEDKSQFEHVRYFNQLNEYRR